MSEFRQDPVTGQWVIISKERDDRPREYHCEEATVDSDFCPFCTGNESSTPEELARYVDEDSDREDPWAVRVVPNKFPALKVEGELKTTFEGLFQKMTGVGAHEVIIEASEHLTDFTQLSTSHAALVLQAWRDRIRDLKGDERLEYVSVFKNHGDDAGATLEHIHSQLLAVPMVPDRISREMFGANKFHQAEGDCVFCSTLEDELATGKRIVCENESCVVLAPYASRVPFELTILPRDHQPRFEEAGEAVLEGVAEATLEALRLLNQALDEPSYNLLVHTAPPRWDDVGAYHWHFELIPTTTQLAGFEWGTDIHINATPPEDAARHLREMKPSDSQE